MPDFACISEVKRVARGSTSTHLLFKGGELFLVRPVGRAKIQSDEADPRIGRCTVGTDPRTGAQSKQQLTDRTDWRTYNQKNVRKKTLISWCTTREAYPPTPNFNVANQEVYWPNIRILGVLSTELCIPKSRHWLNIEIGGEGRISSNQSGGGRFVWKHR